MKKCTWCGKEYQDEATVCAVDCQPLIPLCPSPASPADVPALTTRALWPGRALMFGTVLLVLVNMLIAFSRSRGDLAFSLGAASSQFVIPLLAVLVFSLGSRFRNPHALIRVVLWVSVALLLAKVGAHLAEDGRGHYRQGVYFYEQRKYERAAAEFTKCLRCDPKGNPSKAEVLELRACALAQMGKFDYAIIDLRGALKLNPQNAKASELLDALLVAERWSRFEAVSKFVEPDVLRNTNALTPQDVPHLTTALTGGVTFIRLKAAKALGELGPSAAIAIPTLRQTELDDPDPHVRMAAKAAISRIGESNSVPGN